MSELLENAEAALIETRDIHELRSMIYLQKEQSFEGIPLVFEHQLSTIIDFAVDKGGNVSYVGNSKSQVAELVYSLSNPGRKLLKDTSNGIFQQSQDLGLPKDLVGR